MQQSKIPCPYGKTAIQMPDGAERFLNVPYYRGFTPPQMAEVIEFFKTHPHVKMLWWDGEKLREV